MNFVFCCLFCCEDTGQGIESWHCEIALYLLLVRFAVIGLLCRLVAQHVGEGGSGNSNDCVGNSVSMDFLTTPQED